jgi:2-polyprenyl-3-methyl-5-hydroxy-6-metoxy-1,4-benzoquinol methylase
MLCYNKLMNNPWDLLSTFFDTTRDDTEIPSRVADNMLIAWPVILKFIKRHSTKRKDLRILDYGCGSGSFANKLYQQGYQVTGVDSSEEMIKIAKSAYGNDIEFLLGDSSVLKESNLFSIVISIMTFQFVENIEKTFLDIASVLDRNGIFVFAVHNPEQVKEYLQKRILFENFDSEEKPKEGFLNLRGNKIPIFIRTAEEYNNMLQKLGFQVLLEEYPPFTQQFLEKYPSSDPMDVPEFLILGYKKNDK